ncbi:hypothetical protein ACWF94_35185 [Streptomyces sp. NPDC055078]
MSLPKTPSGGARCLRRGALAVTAAALSFAVLTGCGAGNNAQSLEVKPDTAAATVDTITVQNANVITQPKEGAAGPAAVSATVFNSGTERQTIDSITLTGGVGTVKLAPAKGSGPVSVPAGGSIVIGGKGNASATIVDGQALTKNIGGVQETVFRFSDTGDVKLNAFVMPASGDFKDFGATAPPKPAKPAAGEKNPGKPGDTEGTGSTGNTEGSGNTEGATGDTGNADQSGNTASGTPSGNASEQPGGQSGSESEQGGQGSEGEQGGQDSDGERGSGESEDSSQH